MQKGERLNAVSHLIGTVAAVVGAAALIVGAAMQGDTLKLVSFSIYGASLVTLYLSSTLYHSLSGRAKAFFQKLDHSSIYVLIAGTYTPFSLVAMRGALGWFYFGMIWSLAALGIAIEAVSHEKKRIIPVLLYLTMGWLAVLVVRPLINTLSASGFAWLLAGGLLYTIGVVFYISGSRTTYGHGIWHLFVLGGSACQFVAVLLYVL